MTSPTVADESNFTPPRSVGLESNWAARPSLPGRHRKRSARDTGGLIAVGLMCAYEVGAVTLNEALEEDVLPTLSDLVEQVSFRRLSVRSAKAGGKVGMWAGLVVVAVASEIGIRQRRKRRSAR